VPRTIALVTAGAAAVAVAGAAFALWPHTAPGADAARWPVERLTADPAVALPYVLHVKPTECPAFSLSSPVASEGGLAPDAQYQVRLEEGHTLLAVCLGPASDTARETVAGQVAGNESEGPVNANATVVQAPFGEAVRLDTSFVHGGPPGLTDWHVDHGGYAYVVGYLHPAGDESHRAQAEAMLASLTFDE